MKVLLYLIENDHNLVFFGYKVSTQQHFKTLFVLKNSQEAENSRITGDACF